jgi:hypothetical protein
MAIVNRTLDSSEQRKVIGHQWLSTATGASLIGGQVPWPCVLEKAQFAAFGISGSPTAQIVINRFIPGTGFTAISVGSANALPAFGTSGVLTVGASLPASGSTLLNLVANDVLMLQIGGTTSAVTALTANFVLRPIQDLKSYFGLI